MSQGDTDQSSIGRTLAVVGDRWTMLILRDVFRGVRRFSELVESLGIARNLLAERLARLVEHDVLVKVPYCDRPLRHEYRLTPKGADLSRALIALIRWGDEWESDDTDPTVLVHDHCGTELELELRCPSCDVSVAPTHVRSRSGSLL
ncbi:MAG: helix-turn-helix domain-containing protein [Actinomycetota bacterium]